MTGSSGQVCIPGSHKRNFLPPDNSDERLRGQSLWGDGVPEVDIYDGPPTVANLCPKAGSCIIFTEALRVRLQKTGARALPQTQADSALLVLPLLARCRPSAMSFAACTRLPMHAPPARGAQVGGQLPTAHRLQPLRKSSQDLKRSC